MRIQAGQTVLITGASGGLGVHMARAFGRLRAKLALVAYPGMGLEELHRALEKEGVSSIALALDLRDEAQRLEAVRTAVARLGPVDILVNNAGVEFTAKYHELSEQQIREVITVNLEASMVLTRLVLPGMLERRVGHIVNISSLAGKSGPACQEPYAATKAGLIAFTSSLRASYRGSGVSATVIIPGFVEAGIYARLKARSGCEAPRLLSGCRPEAVAEAVIRGILKDRAEIIVNRFPIRPVLAISALAPALGDWITTRIGVHDFFRRVLASQESRLRQ